jgi:hypothetical protein
MSGTSVMTPVWSLERPCSDTARWLRRRLARLGLRLLQTFDLHDARLGTAACPCPHHGTNECDCQMIVVLVYGHSSQPLTLILHGNDGRTWISFVDRPGQRADSVTVGVIQKALQPRLASGT